MLKLVHGRLRVSCYYGTYAGSAHGCCMSVWFGWEHWGPGFDGGAAERPRRSRCAALHVLGGMWVSAAAVVVDVC